MRFRLADSGGCRYRLGALALARVRVIPSQENFCSQARAFAKVVITFRAPLVRGLPLPSDLGTRLVLGIDQSVTGMLVRARTAFRGED